MDQELDDLLRRGDPETASRLAATVAALRSVPAAEIPRPIRFVSDKVFVPPWWQRLPVWGTASAAMLAVSILAHGWWSRPAVPDAMARGASPVASVRPFDEREASARLEAQVTAQLAASYDRKLEAAIKTLRAEYDQKLDFERRAIQVSVEENFDLLRKQMNRMYVASAAADPANAEGMRRDGVNQ